MTPDDWALYKQVRLAMLLDSPGSFGSTYEIDSNLGEQHWRKLMSKGDWLIDVTNSKPTGNWVVLPDKLYSDSLYLGAMWVTPEMRGTTLATQLINTAFELAEEKRKNKLRLHVAEKNPRAIAFYRKFGFELTGNTELANRDIDRTDLEMISVLMST